MTDAEKQEPELPIEDTAAPEEAQPQPAGENIEGLKLALAEANDKMMRALAEAENTRRRGMKEREDAGKFAISSFAKDLLDFSANFARALAAIPEEAKARDETKAVMEGLSAMERELARVFDRHGIKKIEPLDEVFNPNFHEVMFEAPFPGKANGTIIQVIDAGYVLNDRLLRAAKVGIAKNAEGAGSHQVDQQA